MTIILKHWQMLTRFFRISGLSRGSFPLTKSFQILLKLSVSFWCNLGSAEDSSYKCAKGEFMSQLLSQLSLEWLSGKKSPMLNFSSVNSWWWTLIKKKRLSREWFDWLQQITCTCQGDWLGGKYLDVKSLTYFLKEKKNLICVNLSAFGDNLILNDIW